MYVSWFDWDNFWTFFDVLEANRPFALKGHVTWFLWKCKLYDFAFEKRLVGHILNKIIVIWFFKPAPFSQNEWVRSWSRDENVIFKIMNYVFLNTNFAFKLQGKCWKDDVVTFTAHLGVTIKRLTRYKHKVLLTAMLEGKSMPSNMVANTNHTTLLKNQSAIKYLP